MPFSRFHEFEREEYSPPDVPYDRNSRTCQEVVPPLALERDLFQRIAIATSDWLKCADELDIGVSEPSITDVMAMAIAAAGLPTIHIKKARGNEESRTGYDWEIFRKVNATAWLRYSIQAKRLTLADGRYDCLQHSVGKKKVPQIDLLEQHARHVGSIPLYCFYNSVRDAILASLPLQNCGLDGTKKEDRRQGGCTIAPLAWVKEKYNAPSEHTFSDMHIDSRVVPWRCLVACDHLARLSTNFLAESYSKEHENPFAPRLKKDRCQFMSIAELCTEYSTAFPQDSECYPSYIIFAGVDF